MEIKEELTEWEKSTIKFLQMGGRIGYLENPITDLTKKGYVFIEPPGIVRLTEKGRNFK